MGQMSVRLRREIATRATGLYEYLDHRPRGEASDPATEALLRAWNRAYSPGDTDAFVRRLAWDGLDQDLVRAALSPRLGGAEPPPPPTWTLWLPRILEMAPEVAQDLLSAAPLAESGYFRLDQEPPFLELWVPVLRAARGELDESTPGAIRAVGPSAHQAFDRQLLKEVASFSELAMHTRYGEFQAAWQARRGQASAAEPDPPPDAGYRAFVLSMLRGELSAFFVTYPVLARHVATVAEKWVDRTRELFERLDSDRVAIADHFCAGVDPGVLTWAEPGLSDPHAGRRRVVSLGFDAGLRLVYKPRDVGLERVYNDLVSWAVGEGLEPRHRVLRLLERDGYGWVEFVSHDHCHDRAEVREYYRRAGGLLCLTTLLRGRDLHMENVIATRDGPVLIDLEMLMQPERSPALIPAAPPSTGEARAQWVERSCVATGLLSLIQTGSHGQVYDIGGLRGDGGAAAANPQRVWKGLRSDALCFVQAPGSPPVLKNQVILHGVPQKPEDFVDEVVAGFAATYRFCGARREEILAPGGPLSGFAGRPTRVVFRASQRYALAQYVLAAPAYQRAGTTRSCALDALNRVFSHERVRPVVWPFVAEERRALEALDIPRFSIPTTDTAVRVGDGQRIDGCFTRSGFASVTDLFGGLSEDDLGAQLEVLTDVLVNTVDSRFEAELVLPPPAKTPPSVTPDRGALLLSYALWIGREVVSRTARDGEAGRRSGTPQSPGTGQSEPDGRRHDLYDGTLGTGLFLAALAAVTGDRQWADAAGAAIRSVRTFLDREGGTSSEPEDIGVCRGPGSVVYALTWIGRLLGDPSCLELAVRGAHGIARERIASDRRLDVSGGSAGAILALLALYRERADPAVLDLASCCGRHLLDTQVRMDGGWAWPAQNGTCLAGFAHGAAGIAYALLRLFQVTGDAEFRAAAVRAYRYERSLFSAAHANWPVVGTAAVMNAWCHGAPGITLARTLALDVADDDEVRAEIDVALGTTAGSSGSGSDHLCCGQMGRCEVLFTVGHRLGQRRAVTAAYELAAQVVQRARQKGHFRLSSTGFEYRVFDIGFFRGLSGIGYQLLRMAAPGRLPSVLGFEAELGPIDDTSDHTHMRGGHGRV